MTRPRLQLRLSTLFIVSLLAAGLVWMNVRETLRNDLSELECGFYRGWPFSHTRPHYEVSGSAPHSFYLERTEPFSWSYLAIDVAICLALLAIAAVAIEWATRRMKRKPTSEHRDF